jgi:hypothetical protein
VSYFRDRKPPEPVTWKCHIRGCETASAETRLTAEESIEHVRWHEDWDKRSNREKFVAGLMDELHLKRGHW